MYHFMKLNTGFEIQLPKAPPFHSPPPLPTPNNIFCQLSLASTFKYICLFQYQTVHSFFFLASNFSTQKVTAVCYVTFFCMLRDAVLKKLEILGLFQIIGFKVEKKNKTFPSPGKLFIYSLSCSLQRNSQPHMKLRRKCNSSSMLRDATFHSIYFFLFD